jgi:DnaK suppressor protein
MDDEHARALLQRERERIGRALADVAPPDRDELADVDQHIADEASELLESELDEGLAEQLRDELAAVERAERRLAEGKYGLSVDSGQPIPDARLEAIPWAERTAEEQARLDRGG